MKREGEVRCVSKAADNIVPRQVVHLLRAENWRESWSTSVKAGVGGGTKGGGWGSAGSVSILYTPQKKKKNTGVRIGKDVGGRKKNRPQ